MTEKITNIIAETLCIEPELVVPDARLKEDLGVDSLDVEELGIELEEQFDVSFPRDAMQKCETVESVISMVQMFAKRERPLAGEAKELLR